MEALDGFALLGRMEGIVPALGSSYVITEAVVVAKEVGSGGNVVIYLNGRGGKDAQARTDMIFAVDITL